MFENLSKFSQIFKKSPENPQIIQRNYKIKVPISSKINYKFKKFLRWFGLKDQFGEELIKQETYIEELYSIWVKELILWFLSVFFTGFLIYLAVLPFWSVSLRIAPFTVFSLGLIYYVFIEMLKEVVKIVKR